MWTQTETRKDMGTQLRGIRRYRGSETERETFKIKQKKKHAETHAKTHSFGWGRKQTGMDMTNWVDKEETQRGEH